MNEKNIIKNLDCIIQSYETIKIILQPNLNENKKNFLNDLFDILNFEINIIKQILFEINSNNLSIYINKNIEIISKYIAKLFCFIKENKKKFNSQLIKTFPISFQIIQNTNVNLNQNNFNFQTNIEKNLFSKKFTLPKNKHSNSNLHRFYSPNIELRNNVSTSSLNSYNNINNYNYKNINKNNNNNLNNYNSNLITKKKFNLTNYNSANNSNFHSSNHSTNNLNLNNVKSKKDVYKNLENLGFNVSIESLKPSIYTKYLVKKYIDVADNNNEKIDSKHFKKLNINNNNNNNIKKLYSKNNNYNNLLNNYNNFTTQNSLINNNSFLVTSPNKNNNINIFNNKNKLKMNNKKISVKKNF